jgi:hypothetical protein
MTRSARLFICCLIVTLRTGAAFAQATSTQAYQTPNSPAVAYVYVTSANKVDAFAAALDGKLTPVSGAPFKDDIVSMAATGKYLFGTDSNGNIDSFSILEDGGLAKVETYKGQGQSGGCGEPDGPLVLDRTGATLYDVELSTAGGLCEDYTFEALDIEKTTGKLNYLGSTGPVFLFSGPLSFIGDNVYAYGANCVNYETGQIGNIVGFERHSNGRLTVANVATPTPTAGGENNYCPSLTAADPTNHLAISFLPFNINDPYTPVGPSQLATYTVDDRGNLVTKSTKENMPATEVGSVNDLKMSPSGKLLAVGGSGLQIFHFNGSDPITHYTGLLTKDDVEQFFWDNDNHLYAISSGKGELFVFTITPTSVSQAPGSPYKLTSPGSIVVEPKTVLPKT